MLPGDKGGQCVRLTSPPSCAECHEMWEPEPLGTLLATPGLLWFPFSFTFIFYLHNLKSSITDWLTAWLINWLGDRPKSSSYLVGHTHSAHKPLDPLSQWRQQLYSNPIFWEPFSYFWVDPSAAEISPSSILILLLSPLVRSGNKTADSNMKLMTFKQNCNVMLSLFNDYHVLEKHAASIFSICL